MLKKMYVAAPFFNPHQQALIGHIEMTCERIEVPYFSPRWDSGYLPPDADEAARRTTFDNNARAIGSSFAVLAVLDFLLPDDTGLYLCEKRFIRGEIKEGYGGRSIRRVSLPDTGTVWEMGAAHALGVPVYGYVEDENAEEHRAVNLMLANGCKGILFGRKKLDEFLRSYAMTIGDASNAEPVQTFKLWGREWKGRIL